MGTTSAHQERTTNGAALAAFLVAGIGAFAVGLFVMVNETGLFAAPALYRPAGGVSGRMTFATVVWLFAWALLHWRWNHRQLGSRRVHAATLLLIGVGVLLSFPPVWQLFQ